MFNIWKKMPKDLQDDKKDARNLLAAEWLFIENTVTISGNFTAFGIPCFYFPYWKLTYGTLFATLVVADLYASFVGICGETALQKSLFTFTISFR